MAWTIPVLGKTYAFDHPRRGKFTMKITKVEDQGKRVEGTLIRGTARKIGHIEFEKGETVFVYPHACIDIKEEKGK